MKPMKPIVFLILAFAITMACRAEPTSFVVEKSGSGPAMIFIPGLNSPGEVWQGMQKHYSHYETHALTIKGFAGVELGEEASLKRVKDELIEYIADNKLEKPVIVGHSLGGFLALWAASENTENVGALVIVDSLPFFPLIWNPSATEESMKPMAKQQTDGIAVATYEQREQYYSQNVPTMVISDEDIARVLKWCMDSDPRMTAQAMYEMYTTDLRDDLSNIENKTLILGSWQSAKAFGGTKESVEFLFNTQYQNLANYELAVHDSAKHFIMTDDLNWTLATVDKFLK